MLTQDVAVSHVLLAVVTLIVTFIGAYLLGYRHGAVDARAALTSDGPHRTRAHSVGDWQAQGNDVDPKHVPTC